MRIIYNKNEADGNFYNKKKAVALGNFDGLHIAHISLIKKTKEYKNLASCIWTFSQHTLNVLKNDFHLPHITSNDEKIEILRQEKIDFLIFQDFSLICQLSPEEFIENILINYLNAQVVVCGFDFRFGHKGSGDADFLKARLAKKNIETVIIPPIVYDCQVVSSSFVRTLIESGNMPRVREFLGRPFSVKLPMGDTLTLNHVFPTGKVVPSCGSYDCTCEIDDIIYKAVVTITKNEIPNILINLIDFGNCSSGCGEIKVNFHEKIK